MNDNLTRLKFTVVLFSLVLLCVGCDNCNSQYTYTVPVQSGSILETANLTTVKIDTSAMREMVDRIRCGKFNEVHSVLIYKDGKLVLEEYFQGFKYQYDAPAYRGEYIQWDGKMNHPAMSCTKSFVSAFTGIAIREGFIKSVHEPIFNYLPDHQQFAVGGKEKISIEHLLTMTSGLDWDEWSAAHGTSANDIDRLYFECSDDPVKCVLEKSLIHAPGEVFNYNGGGTVILGEIVENASGMTLGEFSETYLFEPLGIEGTEWFQYSNGVYAADGSMFMKPRDMLKIGVLYLDDGRWKDQQIISADWVEKSATPYNNNRRIDIPIEDSGKNDYSYSWWITEHEYKGEKISMYRANGWGGQTIMIFPELDMVVVFTSGNYAGKSKLFRIVNKHILPAVD